VINTILFEGESAEQLDALADKPGRLRGSMLLWVDLRDPSRDEVDEVAGELGLDDESAERLLDPSDGVSFRDRREYIHVTASAPAHDAHSEPSEIECVVGENWVVTAHERPAAVLDQFAELAEGSGRTGDLDGPMFLAGLLEWVLDEHSSAFERIEDELEQVDSRGMRGESDPENEIERLVTLRLQAGKLRRSLVSHRSLLLALAHPELEALGDEDSARRFERLVHRYEQTLEGARDVRESIFGSFDVLIARTGHRTNEIVKVLTLASVIFLPGALIAGIMGMNFKPSLFTHPLLFWVTIAVIISIGVVTLVAAKARDWI
jgi:magnesium transporter